MKASINIFLTGILLLNFCATKAQKNKNIEAKENKETAKLHKKETRKILEQRYKIFSDASLNNDSTISCSLIHPAARTTMPNGEIWNAERICAYMMAGFRQVKKTYAISFGLDTILVNNDTATVLIHQYWHRLQMKGGKLRDVETSADQWETWVKSNGEYLRLKVDRIIPKIWKVDGKRIDPSKPYDPNAPEYKPDI